MTKLSKIALIFLLVISSIVTNVGAVAADDRYSAQIPVPYSSEGGYSSTPFTIPQAGWYKFTPLINSNHLEYYEELEFEYVSGEFNVLQEMSLTDPVTLWLPAGSGLIHALSQGGGPNELGDSITIEEVDPPNVQLTSDTAAHVFEPALYRSYNSSSRYKNVVISKPHGEVVENFSASFEEGEESPFMIIYPNGDLSSTTNDSASFQVIPRGNLEVGSYSDTLVVTGDNASIINIEFSFIVNAHPAPVLGLNLTEHDFGTLREGYELTQQQISVQKQGHSTTIITGLTASFEKGVAFWIPTISPDSLGEGSTSIAPNINVTSNLAPGVYTDTLTFTADDQDPVSIELTVEILETHDIQFTSKGIVIDSYTIDDGEFITTIPDDPSNAGETFLGWYIMNGSELSDTPFNFDSPPTGDVTLIAKFETNTYVITFEENLGSPVNDIEVDYGNTITLPTNPTRQGYTFAGWYIDAELTENFSGSEEVYNDFTLYAKWLSQNSLLEVRDPEEDNGFELNSEDFVIENADFKLTYQDLVNKLETSDDNASRIEVVRGEEVLGCIYEFYGDYSIHLQANCMDYDLMNQFILDGDVLRVSAEDTSLEHQTEYTIEVADAAVNDSYRTDYRAQLTVTQENGVLSNDTHQNNLQTDYRIARLPEPAGEFTVEVVTTTSNGILELNSDGSFTYLPNTGFSGVDTFTYKITYTKEPIIYGRSIAAVDYSTHSNEATASITVGPRPAPPTPPSDGEIIVVDEDNPNDILIRLLINRQQINGVPTDLITMDEERVRQALENLTQDTSRVIIPPSSDNPVTRITLPTPSQILYGTYQNNLSFEHPYLELYLQNSQILSLQGDLTLSFNHWVLPSQSLPIVSLMESSLPSGLGFTMLNNPVQVIPNQDLTNVRLGLPIPIGVPAGQYSTLRVFVLHSDGTTEWLTVTVENGIAYFTTPSFSTFTLVSVEEPETEGDLPYIQGFEDKTFRPGLAVTRHQIAAMFARKLSGNNVPVTQATFTDTRNSWAKNEIEYVRTNGIMNGVNATMFNPTAPMTRAQIAVTADRYLEKICGMDMTSSSYCGNMAMGKGYSDIRDSDWSATSIKRMQALGIITGYNDGTYRAGEHVTRAQVVTIINRLFDMAPAANYDAPSFTDVSPNYWAYKNIERATRGK